jgi:uncharacterized Fe-S center protein
LLETRYQKFRKFGAYEELAAAEAGLKKGDDMLGKLHNRDYRLQIEEAEKLGLGSGNYELVKI